MTHYKPIIWVEGIIGAGKSTFAKYLAEKLEFRLLSEPVNADFLTLFYENPKRWAFPMQIDLLHRRYAIQKLAAYEVSANLIGSSKYRGCVLDRGLPGDRVFAKLHMLEGNISELEWQTYQRAYEAMTSSLYPPSLVLYLDVEPKTALARVKERDRTFERGGVPLEYLIKLHRGYLDLLVEIESGQHAWSRGMDVMRIPWNFDFQPIEPLIEQLRRKFDFKVIE